MKAAADYAIGPVVCSSEAIASAIERLAAQLARDYCRKPLVLLGVLKGALCLTADLARALAGTADGPNEIMVDYLVMERYGSLGTSGGPARLGLDCSLPIGGRNVLVVEDIVDTGLTMAFLQTLLAQRDPASLRTCALLARTGRRDADVKLDYYGMAVPDVFAIGYGLDFKELYRNLPYVAELREGQTV